MKTIRLLSLISLLLFALSAQAAKKVLILYSTGGHATAARSIEQMLNQYPEEFEVIRHDFAENLTGLAHWFYKKGYDTISQNANWINKLGVSYKWLQSELLPLYASQRFNAHFNQPEKILNYVQSIKPDVIISTHFSVADTLAMLREQGHLTNIPIAWTHLDVVDNTFFRQIGDQLDMSFLPTERMEHNWSTVIEKEKMMSVGIPIMSELLNADAAPTDKTELENLKRSLGLDIDKPTVLLMGGSMGALSYETIIKEVAEAFRLNSEDSVSEKVQFVAICGRNEDKAKKLIQWSQQANFASNITLHATGFIDHAKMRRMQNASDLIISKPGGLTTFELLTTGKPVIMTEGIGLQEKYNAQYVAQEKAALFFAKTNGIGQAAYKLLRSTDKQSEILVKNQKTLRQNFKLNHIIEWVRTARILQATKPTTPILTRIRELRKQESVASAYGGKPPSITFDVNTALICSDIFGGPR